MEYLEWNYAIAQSFFNPQAAQRPVYLYITHDRLEAVGRPHGVGADDFLKAVRSGPAWITDGRLSLCGKAHRLFDDWTNARDPAGLGFPPYIAYLALFVLAAGVEGDFAAHAYYPRLHRLLGEPESSGTPAAFDRMWELWLDLEDWSKSDRGGEVGIFNISISGGWQHVGLPIGQTLLSEEERHNLVELFAKCALDPKAPPTEGEMLALLRDDKSGALQRRSKRLLDASADAHVRAALVQAAIAELQHWDGMFQVSLNGSVAATSVATLRLCCRLDLTARRASMRLRLRSSAPYPEAELNLRSPALSQSMTCEEAALGWSTELVSSETGVPVDASSVPWAYPLEINDPDRQWRAALPASRVRLFQGGGDFGLPGFVEAPRLVRGSEFVLIASEHIQEIEAWGANGCSDFQSIPIVSGLPSGWQLFLAKSANDDSTIKDLIPRLALPSSLRILLRAGIRTQEGSASRYFNFAKPNVCIDSPVPDVVVTCNGAALLECSGGTHIYELPADAPLDTPLRIEAKTTSGDEARTSLTVAGSTFSRWQEQTVRFGEFGERVLDSTGIRGAIVYGTESAQFNFGIALPPLSVPKAYLVGQIPGEISCWPKDPLPPWQPVWAVAMDGRRGFVVPCMADLAGAGPDTERRGSPKAVKEWKEIIWHLRKRVAPPPKAAHARLWEQYKEVASRVR